MDYYIIKYNTIIISYYKKIIKNNLRDYKTTLQFIKKHKDLQNFLDYQFLCLCPIKNKKFKYSTKIFWVLNDVIEFPKCKNPNCSNIIVTDCLINGEYKHERCSRKCVSTDPTVKKRKEDTCLAKFGAKYMFQSETFKKESSETCFNKYGKKCYVQTNEFKEKSKLSCIKHYRVEYASQSKEFQSAIVNTSLKKYGVHHYTQSVVVKEKAKNTWLERYGVDNPSKSEKKQR